MNEDDSRERDPTTDQIEAVLDRYKRERGDIGDCAAPDVPIGVKGG